MIVHNHNPKAAYRDFLASDAWKEFRKRALAHFASTCRRCGVKRTLQIHHKHYLKPWGQEDFDDVECLCRSCHEKAHGINKPSKKRKRKRPRHQRPKHSKAEKERRRLERLAVSAARVAKREANRPVFHRPAGPVNNEQFRVVNSGRAVRLIETPTLRARRITSLGIGRLNGEALNRSSGGGTSPQTGSESIREATTAQQPIGRSAG